MERKTTQILNDLIINKYKQSYVAKKNEVSPTYISTICKKIKQLKYLPKIKDDKIVCLECDGKSGNNNLCIHHDYELGQTIAIVCLTCNFQIGNKTEFENGELSGYYYTINDRLYNEELDNDSVRVQLMKSTAKRLKSKEVRVYDHETYDEIINRLMDHYVRTSPSRKYINL